MNELLINEFEGNKIYSFIWNGRPCWIAIQIGDLLDYKEPSKAVFQCINSECFEIGKEYDILKKGYLKKFKVIASQAITSIKYAPRLIIFYEDGLYGFLQFSKKTVGINFKKWIRREVLPSIRREGQYTLNKSDIEKRKEVQQKDNLRIAYKSSIMFKELLEKVNCDDLQILRAVKSIYEEAGVDLDIELN